MLYHPIAVAMDTGALGESLLLIARSLTANPERRVECGHSVISVYIWYGN
jgi:hypothetical protein